MDVGAEQDLFERQLPELLETHRGQFALVKDGSIRAFYQTYREAYRAGLEMFGLDQTYLVAQVIEPRTIPISMAWQAGVAIDG